MKSHKVEYIKSVNELRDSTQYIAQIKVNGIDNSLIKIFRYRCFKNGFSVLKSKFNLANMVIPVAKGNTLIIGAADKNKLIAHLKQNSITSYSYYNIGDLAQEDIIIQKGNLRLKAGSILALFERYGSIKLTKGMIELLDPIQLVKKGQKISKDVSKILQLLDKKIKINHTEVVNLYQISTKSSSSQQFLELVFAQPVDSKVNALIKSLTCVSKYSFLHDIPKKLAQLIQFGIKSI